MRLNWVWAALAASAPLWAMAVDVTTVQARDVNGDGTTDAYYDPAFNITYLADASLTITLGGYTPPGWPPGVVWFGGAQGIADDYTLGGVGGWRLPHAQAGDCAAFLNSSAAPECTETAPLTSELAHARAIGLPFVNPQAYTYFTDGVFDGPYPYRIYADLDGRQVLRFDGDMPGYVVLVHDGDVAPPVPEPQTYALLMLGLGALALRVRGWSP